MARKEEYFRGSRQCLMAFRVTLKKVLASCWKDRRIIETIRTRFG